MYPITSEVTLHSLQRAKERCNLKNPRSAVNNIQRAFARGKRAEDCTSWERTYLSSEPMATVLPLPTTISATFSTNRINALPSTPFRVGLERNGVLMEKSKSAIINDIAPVILTSSNIVDQRQRKLQIRALSIYD